MDMLILHNKSQARAYSADLLAGCAGYPDAKAFLDACQKNDQLLEQTASVIDPTDQESGKNAATSLRHRLIAENHSILHSPADVLAETNKNKFEQLSLAGFGAVLLQAVRNDNLRAKLTTAAITLATGIALTLSTGVMQEAKADNLASYLSKDGLGALIGGAIGHKIGGGNGQKVATIAGALAGILVAEKMQSPQPNRMQSINNPGNSTQGGQGPVLVSGTMPLPYDKNAKLVEVEQRFLATRSSYAKSLYNLQQAQDDMVLDPHNAQMSQQFATSNETTKTVYQSYKQAATDFVKASEYLGQRGYDVTQFGYAHRLAYAPVTSQDMSQIDLAEIGPVPAQQNQVHARAQQTNGYNP